MYNKKEILWKNKEHPYEEKMQVDSRSPTNRPGA